MLVTFNYMILFTICLVKGQYNLTCYVCHHVYPNTQLYAFDDCEQPNNTNSSLVPLPCNSFEDTCMVKRFASNGILSEIRRSCVKSDECNGDRGCKLTNYGLTTSECTTCCSTPACNVGNNSTKLRINTLLNIVLFILQLSK